MSGKEIKKEYGVRVIGMCYIHVLEDNKFSYIRKEKENRIK